MTWPQPDDDFIDPAFKPLIESGQGEAEGFELAERDLVQHATHTDEEPSTRIIDDADSRDEEETGAEYGEADSELHPDA